MTVKAETYIVRYQGDGRADSVYPIPFGFTSLSTVVVRTLESGVSETPVVRTIDVDYTINPTITGGTDEAIEDVFAEGGWVIWIGASPTGIVEIAREEEMKQSYPLDGSLDSISTENLEKSLDRMTMAMSASLKREQENPEAYSCNNRSIENLGHPVRFNDAVTKNRADVLKGTESRLAIPATVSQDFFLSAAGLYPSTPFVRWVNGAQLPIGIGIQERDVLVSSGLGGCDWEELNWIPEPPNDGLFNCLYSDGLGEMSWRAVYEVPLSTEGDTDDVLMKSHSNENLIWQALKNENFIENRDEIDRTDRFASYVHWNDRHDVLGGLPEQRYEEGGKITYGTESFTVTVPEYTQAPYHSGNGTMGALDRFDPVEFEFEHGIPDFDYSYYNPNTDTEVTGTKTGPSRVFYCIENPVYTDASGVDSCPFWVMRLNDLGEDDDGGNSGPGLDSTYIRGKIQYLNVNDTLKSGAEENAITNCNLPLTDYTFYLHWIAIGYCDIDIW